MGMSGAEGLFGEHRVCRRGLREVRLVETVRGEHRVPDSSYWGHSCGIT